MRDFSRQESCVPTDEIQHTSATVIGVGAIGRNVALQLAAIGVPDIQVIDFDHVDESNITTQGYHDCDIGEPKVEIVAESIKKIDGGINVEAINEKYHVSQKTKLAIFSCVDSMTFRKQIWQDKKTFCGFWCDGRMRAETIRILSAITPEDHEAYSKTLFTDAEAIQDGCTSQSTIYASNIAAGLMVHQFTRYLRGYDIDTDLLLNILTSEISV